MARRLIAAGKRGPWRMPRCPMCASSRKHDPCENCGESTICSTCGGFRWHSRGCTADPAFVDCSEPAAAGVRGRS